MTMAGKTYITIDRRDCDDALQIGIHVEDESGGSQGYRIAGPKYDGHGSTLLKHLITERDAREIIEYLRPETKKKRRYDKATRTFVTANGELMEKK
jgi:hypothetical protein